MSPGILTELLGESVQPSDIHVAIQLQASSSSFEPSSSRLKQTQTQTQHGLKDHESSLPSPSPSDYHPHPHPQTETEIFHIDIPAKTNPISPDNDDDDHVDTHKHNINTMSTPSHITAAQDFSLSSSSLSASVLFSDPTIPIDDINGSEELFFVLFITTHEIYDETRPSYDSFYSCFSQFSRPIQPFYTKLLLDNSFPPKPLNTSRDKPHPFDRDAREIPVKLPLNPQVDHNSYNHNKLNSHQKQSDQDHFKNFKTTENPRINPANERGGGRDASRGRGGYGHGEYTVSEHGHVLVLYILKGLLGLLGLLPGLCRVSRVSRIM